MTYTFLERERGEKRLSEARCVPRTKYESEIWDGPARARERMAV